MRSLMTVYEITQNKKILTLINFQPSQIGFRSLFIHSSKNNPIYRIFIDFFYPIFMLNERNNHTENFQLIFREVLNAQKNY